MKQPFIYLASCSPRRRELLTQLGVSFESLEFEIPEIRQAGENPKDFVRRMAVEKAREGLSQLATPSTTPVLGADTIVVLNETVLGKPANRQLAEQQLGLLSGQRHQVITAVALCAERREVVRSATTTVWFRELSAGERSAYCVTGEPLDKAGSYAIQGLAAAFIRRIDGSYSGVMGLPLYETAELLSEFGLGLFSGTDNGESL